MSEHFKDQVRRNFSADPASYEQNALLQKQLAATLVSMLPLGMIAPKILEIGCGTGFVTDCLLERYPDAHILATDPAWGMIEHCQTKYKDYPRVTHEEMSAEEAITDLAGDSYALVVTGLAAQWFDNPFETLKALAALGPVYYSTIGTRNHPEWAAALEAAGVSNTAQVKTSLLPDVVREDEIPVAYGSARGFIDHLRKTGAQTPRGNHTIRPGELRRAMTAFDAMNPAGTVTWHIVTGHVPRTRSPVV